MRSHKPFRIAAAALGVVLLTAAPFLRSQAVFVEWSVWPWVGLLMAAGLVLIFLGCGYKYGSALFMCFVSATCFVHYYIAGNDDGWERAFSGTLFMSLAALQFFSAKRGDRNTSAVITELHLAGGGPHEAGRRR